MDILSEDFIENPHRNFKLNNDFSIGCMEWVDDVLSVTTGTRNQISVLNSVDEFAKKSKLEWGASKCQVMQVGRKVMTPDEWQLGERMIKNTTSYRYLGDIVTSNNRNKMNLEEKENKMNNTIRQINTTASSDVMRGVEARVLLILYEKSVVPSLINNCESWTLSPSEEEQVDRMGIRALKRLFSLPTTTPNAALIYSLGQLYVTQEIDQKRLIFLHKILMRESSHWTSKMLFHLQECNLGWAKNINEKLIFYHLETDWSKIRSMTKNQWKTNVKGAVEKINKDKLLKSCTTVTTNETKICTKTKHIHQQLSNTPTTFERGPLKEVVCGSRLRAKTIIIARHGMLECGSNFKGTMPQTCQTCSVLDNENHRLNECRIFSVHNYANSPTKCNFTDVYADNDVILKKILTDIEKIWDFRFANGKVRKY